MAVQTAVEECTVGLSNSVQNSCWTWGVYSPLTEIMEPLHPLSAGMGSAFSVKGLYPSWPQQCRTEWSSRRLHSQQWPFRTAIEDKRAWLNLCPKAAPVWKPSDLIDAQCCNAQQLRSNGSRWNFGLRVRTRWLCKPQPAGRGTARVISDDLG
jgi:hypothetical protein